MEQENKVITVNNKKISLIEFQEIINDPKIFLKKISENNYITKMRLYG